MLGASLLVATIVAFSAAVLSGFTGFGHAVIVVPVLLLVYDPRTVVALACMPSASGVAARLHYGGPIILLGLFAGSHVLPARRHYFKVEPRGFEPLTSAVQR